MRASLFSEYFIELDLKKCEPLTPFIIVHYNNHLFITVTQKVQKNVNS